jgi:hypothetical protein
MPDSLLTDLWLCLSALAAGAVNAVASGGTLLTFPTARGAAARPGPAWLAHPASLIHLPESRRAGGIGHRPERPVVQPGFFPG